MAKVSYKLVVLILFYLLVFSFLINSTFKHLDADFGWHLEVGKQILAEKAVPSVEYYNYTLVGEKWVDHEWLMNLIMYWVYENCGYFFLNILFALIIILTLVLLKNYTQKHFIGRGKGIFLIMFFQFFGVLAMSPHLGIRIQEITLLCLTLLLIIIHSYEATGNPKKLLWFLPLFCFWANAHAGFLIGIFILFMWIGVKILLLIINKLKLFKFVNAEITQSTKEIFIFFIFALVAVAVTFINPYGLKLYAFLSSYANDGYLKVISEWMPVYYLPIQYKQIIYSAIITAMLVLLSTDIYSSYKKKKKITLNLWQLGLTVLFLYLAFKSKRHFPLFFIVSFPWLISSILHNFILTDSIKKFFQFGKILRGFIIIALLLVTAKYFIFAQFAPDPFSAKHFCSIYPCEAITHIKNSPEIRDKKIFNNYGWGGFMLHVWPEKKLFIDGRLPIYEFAGHTLLEEYLEFFKEEKVEEKLNQYDIELVLLKKFGKIKLNKFEKFFFGLDEEKINKQKMDLKDYLDNSSEWRLVYEDRISSVYMR